MNRDLPNGVLRGQMYYANLDPVVGSEQGGNRPVLVIQNNVGNRHSPTIIIAPITTRVKKLHQPTHIGVPPYFGLPQNSMAMLEQIRTIDKGRLGSYIGCLDDDVMDYVDEALGISVGSNLRTSLRFHQWCRRSPTRRSPPGPGRGSACRAAEWRTPRWDSWTAPPGPGPDPLRKSVRPET